MSSATVLEYVRDGRIPAAHTPGGRYLFDLEEVRSVLFVVPLTPLTSPNHFVDIFGVADGVSGSKDVLE